jgi:HJR/Mrr/RecB family endonuclease
MFNQENPPQYESFGLSNDLVIEIKRYNECQENKKSLFTKYLISIIILVSAILMIFSKTREAGLAVLAVFMPPILFLSYFLLEKILKFIFPPHILHKKLEAYETAFCEFEKYLRQKEVDYWSSLSGISFERQFALLLQKFADEVILTKGSGDGGVDIIIKNNQEVIIIQCKNHKKPVGPESVRALVGVLHVFNASKAIFVSVGGYTKGSKIFSKSHKNLYLWDMEDILKIVKLFHSTKDVRLDFENILKE